MRNEIVITFKGTYVQAIANGEKDFEYSTQLWTELSRLATITTAEKYLA